MTHHPVKPALLDLLRQAQISQNAFFYQAPEAEQAQSGTPECWSAKDHVAHLTFWRQRLALRVKAILQSESQPEALNFEQVNPLIFEEYRSRPWAALLPESDQVYADLIALTSQLTEEELTAWGRFDGEAEDTPFYIAFMGNCYEHTQIHLAQYCLDRYEPARALEIHEILARRVGEASVPDLLKGHVLYNLACFYATHSRPEQARPALQQAFLLYPATREFALTDPDLVALRLDSTP